MLLATEWPQRMPTAPHAHADDMEHMACAAHARLQAAPCAGPLGYTRSSDWDLLWSPARLALKAAAGGVVRAGQLISAYPGLMSLTRKVKRGILWLAEGRGCGALSTSRCCRLVHAQLGALSRIFLPLVPSGLLVLGTLMTLIDPSCHIPQTQRRLPATLYAAYGEGAWELMPQSFQIPDVGGAFGWVAQS